MNGTLTGTGRLVLLVLRRDRVILAVWLLLTVLLPASIAASTTDLFPGPAEREAFAAMSMSSPAQLVARGVIYAPTVGGLAPTMRPCRCSR